MWQERITKADAEVEVHEVEVHQDISPDKEEKEVRALSTLQEKTELKTTKTNGEAFKAKARAEVQAEVQAEAEGDLSLAHQEVSHNQLPTITIT